MRLLRKPDRRRRPLRLNVPLSAVSGLLLPTALRRARCRSRQLAKFVREGTEAAARGWVRRCCPIRPDRRGLELGPSAKQREEGTPLRHRRQPGLRGPGGTRPGEGIFTSSPVRGPSRTCWRTSSPSTRSRARYMHHAGRLHLIAGEQDPEVSDSLSAAEYLRIRKSSPATPRWRSLTAVPA